MVRDIFILWLINPPLSLYFGLRNFRKVSVVITITLFCAFYGLTMKLYEDSKDSSRYRDKFYAMHDQSLDWNTFQLSLFDGEKNFDVAVPLITYSVAQISRNEQLLFMVFGVIFGFFYGKNLELLLIFFPPNKKYNGFFVFLLFVFMLIIPFWTGINGVRMWTAAHIFFYGASRLMYFDDKDNYIFVILAILFHFSFLLPSILLLIFRFLPFNRFISFYFTVFIFSFLASEINIGDLTSFVRNNSPSFLAAKAEGYTKDIYVQTFQDKIQTYSWHAQFYGKALKYSIISLVFLVYFVKNEIENDFINKFLSFSLILLSFANIFSLLPSGGRFYSIAFLFAMIPILFLATQEHFKLFSKILIVPLLFWMIVNIREGFDMISVGTLISNPVLSFTKALNDTPLINFIK